MMPLKDLAGSRADAKYANWAIALGLLVWHGGTDNQPAWWALTPSGYRYLAAEGSPPAPANEGASVIAAHRAAMFDASKEETARVLNAKRTKRVA